MTPQPPTDLGSALGREFAAEMARRRLPRTAVANAAGMSRTTFYRKLTGASMTVPEAASIARAIGAPLSDFIRQAEWAMDGEPATRVRAI